MRNMDPHHFSVFDMDRNGSISETEFYSVREQRMAAKASEGKKMRCMAAHLHLRISIRMVMAS